MYDPNSVLGRGLALRESQQAGKKRKTDTGLSERAAQPAVQTQKKNWNDPSKPHTATSTHTHTHYIIPPPPLGRFWTSPPC